MSTRQLLNLTTGAFALLLLAALGIVFSTLGSQSEQDARIDLTINQQVLIQDLTRQAAVLAAAEDRESVATARQNMARTIVKFDGNLASLLHGGDYTDADGQKTAVTRTGNDSARQALEEAAQLWLQTGPPLADLAAGEFSVFSAAGQQAVRELQGSNVELMQAMGTAANALRMGQHTRATIAGIARWAAAALALVLIGLTVFRRRLLKADAPGRATTPAAKAAQPPAGQSPATNSPTPHVAETAGPFARSNSPLTNASAARGFTAPVDFDSVSASVDQMSVDMNTIAGSTDKMRQAIDSVGHALQGMLYSLNEMAHDTAEGHRIVRNANNAASFTANAAGDLAASAREMADVVARVTQLAQRTKQVAAQIDGEAAITGKTGESFTSVVAGEVHGLSQQTNQATREIEDTVAGILATARQYEEAIGQIIKNVSAINKVSEHLGELMLNPPARVEPAAPPAPAPVLTPAAVPVEVAAAPTTEPPVAAIPDDPITPAATPEEMAAETASAIAAAADEPEPETEDATDTAVDLGDDSIFMLGSKSQDSEPLNIPEMPAAVDAPEAAPEPEPAVEEDADSAAAEQASPVAETPTEPTDSDEDAGLEVFMLNKPKADAEADAAAPVAAEAEPAPTPAPEPPTGEDDEPVIGEASPPEPEPETVPAGDEPALGEEGSNANIFMLNKPK